MINPESIRDTELHQYLGAHCVSDSRVRFCVWSPTSDQVHVHLEDRSEPLLMTPVEGGYHVTEIEGVESGDRYLIQFDGGTPRPDPVSRSQPRGVHRASAVVDPTRFEWSDDGWTGVKREDWVIYELHVGGFTDEGTFVSAIERLDELVELGVTVVELMPVAESAGRWNWGYDGVCWFAPTRNFGTPDDLRRFVDAAHSRGLAVVLDVVYNHLGPEGNYLGEAGPYLSERHSTVWGAAPNFDDSEFGREVRRFVVANVIHWFDEYHIDGLRVDAIHCMRDDSEPHIAAEISAAAKEWSHRTGRPANLIAESNVYDPNMLESLDNGGIGFEAEWCDDFLHSVYAVARPGEKLCHRPYRPGVDLEQTLKFGYVYEGTLREERGRCEPTSRVDTRGLIYSIQQHDFIGNHPLGRRLHQLTSKATQRAAATLLMTSPGIPMMFMGEDFACERPFQFFVDFTDDYLRQSVVEGRRREYPQHDWSSGRLPIDPDAFHESKIGSLGEGDPEMRRWYETLIRLRKSWRRTGILDEGNLTVRTDHDIGLFVLTYHADSASVTVAVRLTDHAKDANSTPRAIEASGTLLLDSRPNETRENELLPSHAKVYEESAADR